MGCLSVVVVVVADVDDFTVTAKVIGDVEGESLDEAAGGWNNFIRLGIYSYRDA